VSPCRLKSIFAHPPSVLLLNTAAPACKSSLFTPKGIMRVLFASSPIIGHVNPTLVAARVLKDAGHETAFYTGRTFGERVEAAGIRFFPLPPEADYDMTQPGEVLPEMSQLAPGLPQMLYVCKALFVDRIPAQAKGLDLVLQEFHPDVIVYETSFSGVLPLLLGPRSARPACTYLGVVNLMLPVRMERLSARAFRSPRIPLKGRSIRPLPARSMLR